MPKEVTSSQHMAVAEIFKSGFIKPPQKCHPKGSFHRHLNLHVHHHRRHGRRHHHHNHNHNTVYNDNDSNNSSDINNKY